MSTLEERLRKITAEAEGKVTEDAKGKIVRRVHLTDAQKALMREAKDSLKQAAELMSKAETLRRKFWCDLEIQTGLYLNNMRYDDELGDVVVYESPLDK